MSNYRIDDLQINNLKLKQDKDLFCFGTDSVLLANFANPKKGNILLDIGTGNGIIPILLSAKTDVKKIIGLEIQEASAKLAEENVKINNLENLIEIINGDIKSDIFQNCSFDYITCNPPYKPIGGGIKNENTPLAIARHEVKCTLNDIIEKASLLLKSKGKFALVHKPERLAEIIYTMKINHIEPKRLQMVYSRINTPPCLILLEGVKNGGIELKNSPPLYVYDEKGNYTANISALYNKRKDDSVE